MSYITPAPYLTNNYTTKLRSFILEKSWIRHLVVIPDGVFPEASVDNAVIVLERVDDLEKRKVGEVEFKSMKAIGDYFELASTSRVKQALWDQDKNHIFLPKVETALYKFRVPTVRLGEIATVNFGMQLRDRRIFPEDVLHSPNSRPKDHRYKPCYGGDDVHRYDLRYSDLYAFFDPVARRGGCWDEQVHFAKHKLIIRQIGRNPVAAYDFRDYCCLNVVFMVVVRHRMVDPKYVLALLNSCYIRSYWLQHFYDRKETFPKIKGTYLLQLPIRRIDFTTPAKERARLLEKGKRLYEDCMAKGQLCVTGFVEHTLKQKPDQADVVHDLLAFLAEQMMEMNKKKQAEVKGFLGWLEREIQVKIEDLANKTRIKEYHESSFEDLLEILKANRKRLGVDPGRREFSERLKVEFDRSVAKLRPLKDRLAATDRLIDQIIYRLYGLTEEEIKIVERGSG